MYRLALVQATPLKEVAVLQISSDEHDTLHQRALSFVNDNQVFGKLVSDVKVPAQALKPTGMAVIVHSLKCVCTVSSCCE